MAIHRNKTSGVLKFSALANFLVISIVFFSVSGFATFDNIAIEVYFLGGSQTFTTSSSTSITVEAAMKAATSSHPKGIFFTAAYDPCRQKPPTGNTHCKDPSGNNETCPILGYSVVSISGYPPVVTNQLGRIMRAYPFNADTPNI